MGSVGPVVSALASQGGPPRQMVLNVPPVHPASSLILTETARVSL